MAGLWTGLTRTLAKLEAIAAEPEERLSDGDVLDALPALQYGLHTAGELTLGISPPAEAEWAHSELAAALADARDATAEVGEAAATGGVLAALPLVPEWRGALFRVRLARMRLNSAPAPVTVVEPPEPERFHDHAALAATVLVVAGTFVVTCGAVLAMWPLWAAGLVLVGAGLLAYRP
jgi:hypothetical protein